jgi:hypothetical protein
MKKYGVVITQNYKPIDFLRFNSDEEAESIYKKYKEQGYGVVKVNIEKAYEVYITNIPEI